MSYFVEKDGRRRKNAITVECKRCSKKITSRLDQVRKYCSRECSSLAQRNRIETPCGYCGKAIQRQVSKKSKSGLFFCSREHKDWAQRIDTGMKEMQPPHYGDGKSSYRGRALFHYRPVCEGCKYSEYETMLDVHHIDGDRNNGTIGNLMVLCVFCHALITRGLAKILPNRQIIRSQ